MRGELLLLLLSLALVKSEVNQTLILKYEEYEIPDMRFVCLNYEVSANISAKCAEQLEVVCGNTTLFMTMLDATSKFPYSGLGYSTRRDYGNFDQCMSINHEYAGGRILGKHCTAGLLIPDILGDVSDTSAYYQLSVCKPDACSADDFVAIASTLVDDFPHLFQDTLCQTIESNTKYTAADIVTITIFAIVLLLMTVSTIYDIYLFQAKTKSHHPLFLAFSVLSNGRKLLQVSKNSKEQIQAFHGIRVISIMWIVAGHEFSAFQSAAITNVIDTDVWYRKRYAAYITTGPLAVDTFFYMSGFLIVFQYLKQKPKPLKEQLLSVPHMYIHRYLRITPAMLMIYLVVISIFKHLGSGPTWTYGAENAAQTCRDAWWPFFLYIQNYYYPNMDKICLTQTWYLSADMQMFIFAPLVLIPLSLNLRKSSGFMISMVEMFILNLFFIVLPMTLHLTNRNYVNYLDTHSRAINYTVGMTLGLFMRLRQDKPFLYGARKIYNIPISIINLVTWIVMLLAMLTILMVYQEEQLNDHSYESGTVFDALMRPVWCLGLSWVVYACYHGYGGIVNWFLSAPLMHVLGKLTYCIYLTHITVLTYYLITAREKMFFSDYNMFYIWCGNFIMSIVVATFWTLAFESPLIIIEKQLLGGRSKKSQPQKNLEPQKRHEPQNGNTSTEAKRENVY